MNVEKHGADVSLFSETFMLLIMLTIVAFSMLITLEQALAQGSERSGKEVVEATCIACHGTGENGAPKIGDAKAWNKRAAKGLSGLTQNALKGIRKMPPHGANMTLTDFEIKRAVAYMVNQSGGHWTEPTSRTKPPARTHGQRDRRRRGAPTVMRKA